MVLERFDGDSCRNRLPTFPCARLLLNGIPLWSQRYIPRLRQTPGAARDTDQVIRRQRDSPLRRGAPEARSTLGAAQRSGPKPWVLCGGLDGRRLARGTTDGSGCDGPTTSRGMHPAVLRASMCLWPLPGDDERPVPVSPCLVAASNVPMVGAAASRRASRPTSSSDRLTAATRRHTCTCDLATARTVPASSSWAQMPALGSARVPSPRLPLPKTSESRYVAPEHRHPTSTARQCSSRPGITTGTQPPPLWEALRSAIRIRHTQAWLWASTQTARPSDGKNAMPRRQCRLFAHQENLRVMRRSADDRREEPRRLLIFFGPLYAHGAASPRLGAPPVPAQAWVTYQYGYFDVKCCE